VSDFIHFGLLGASTGVLYALAALGLVLIYRGSGVLNFAHGAVGVAGAYVYWELDARHGQSYAVALVCGVAFAALIGVLLHLLVMRRLRRASALVRVVATLGVLVLLQGVQAKRYGADVYTVGSVLPVDLWKITSDITITSDRVYLMIIAVTLTAALWAGYRFSRFGIGTAAVAENQRAAANLGWSPDVIAAANWGLGSGLAGLATILMIPIATLQGSLMTNLLLVTLAAALVGNFSSFWLTLLGGVGIGIVQGEFDFYSLQWGDHAIGLSQSVPFFVVMLLLVLRGRALPLRDFFLQRLPAVGNGRVRWDLLLAFTALTLWLVIRGGGDWASAWTTTFTAAILLLSIVVVTGYAGQISLAQFAIAAFGAWAAARAVQSWGWPFWAAFPFGVAATVPLGALFALPAVRTRGINLAIVTLGLGSALEYMLFGNASYVGGGYGSIVGQTHLFGWDVYSVTHPQRWAAICLVGFVLCALIVANVRRGRSGRRLIAVRTNERAAAALGISVVSAKVYAFSLAAGIAAVGGILMFFRSNAILFPSITNASSIMLVAIAVIGGLGYLLGPVMGALLWAGAISAQVIDVLFGYGVSSWLQVVAGAFLILLVLQEPDGMAKAQIHQAQWIAKQLSRLPLPAPPWRRAAAAKALPDERRERVAPKTLEVRDLTVRYGAVIAVSEVSLTIKPGEIVGLIGPNGAGKTTLVDAVTGFTRPSAGSLLLDGADITGWSAVRRARAGVSRSFQSLELFEDMTVLDNLRTASEPRDAISYVTDLVYPRIPPIPGEVVAAIREFELTADLDRRVEDLAYGKRRLLAMARAVATQPSVLLLDECAAGLSEGETRELAHLVRRLADDWGMSILLIEHDVNFVMSVSDHIVVLDFGLKISEGPPDFVRNDPKVIAAYLGGAPDGAAAGGAVDPSAVAVAVDAPREA